MNTPPIFVVPQEADLRPPIRYITGLALELRFSDAEFIKIDMASRADTYEGAKLRRFLSKSQRAEYVDLDNEAYREDLRMLENDDFLVRGRAADIYGGQIEPHEIPLYFRR